MKGKRSQGAADGATFSQSETVVSAVFCSFRFLLCVHLWSSGLPRTPRPPPPHPHLASSDHTPHVSLAWTRLQEGGGAGGWGGGTSSDLANKHSINGAVERVTHASQNLLRSNSPLQFPLHWADPQAAGPKHRPGHRPPRCQVTRRRGSGPLPGASARKRCQC